MSPEAEKPDLPNAPKENIVPGEHIAVRWFENKVSTHGLKTRYAATMIITFWLLAVIVFGIVMSFTDRDTFPTVWLGMWWAVETVTTVGYGDVVPVSTPGKVMAVIMMLGGLSMLAVVTATITSAFVSRAREHRALSGDDPIMARLEELSVQIAAMQTQLDGRASEETELPKGPPAP